jgi:spore coat polysaccharide biosynthesis protein SpsF (cytidylyltransferase family)
VLADIEGEPMLALLLRRVAAARSLTGIVVATSEGSDDDPVAAAAVAAGAAVHRGPLDDVLARLAGAAAGHDGAVVRLTADCPLADPAVIDETVQLLERSPLCRYASNVEPRTYPDGLDVEALPAATLRELDATVADPDLREHVTLAIRRAPDRWGAAALVHRPDLGALRWTVDTEDDLRFVRAVVGRLGAARHSAGIDAILAAVRAEPSLAEGGLRG